MMILMTICICLEFTQYYLLILFNTHLPKISHTFNLNCSIKIEDIKHRKLQCSVYFIDLEWFGIILLLTVLLVEAVQMFFSDGIDNKSNIAVWIRTKKWTFWFWSKCLFILNDLLQVHSIKRNLLFLCYIFIMQVNVFKNWYW